ncbi:hypothetical protein YC2023_081513 [Brassica napus]
MSTTILTALNGTGICCKQTEPPRKERPRRPPEATILFFNRLLRKPKDGKLMMSRDEPVTQNKLHL